MSKKLKYAVGDTVKADGGRQAKVIANGLGSWSGRNIYIVQYTGGLKTTDTYYEEELSEW